MRSILDFFIFGKWIYKNDRIYNILNRLSDEEKQEFDCDVQYINWPKYLEGFPTGMFIWSLNQDLIGPERKMDQIILQNRFRFDQLKLAFGRGKYLIN